MHLKTKWWYGSYPSEKFISIIISIRFVVWGEGENKTNSFLLDRSIFKIVLSSQSQQYFRTSLEKSVYFRTNWNRLIFLQECSRTHTWHRTSVRHQIERSKFLAFTFKSMKHRGAGKFFFQNLNFCAVLSEIKAESSAQRDCFFTQCSPIGLTLTDVA